MKKYDEFSPKQINRVSFSINSIIFFSSNSSLIFYCSIRRMKIRTILLLQNKLAQKIKIYSISNNFAFLSTALFSLTYISLMVPETGACKSFSIFMASSIIIESPFSTWSPG